MCRASIKIDGSSATERIITVDGPTDAIFKVRLQFFNITLPYLMNTGIAVFHRFCLVDANV
jgi:hypothetical protein